MSPGTGDYLLFLYSMRYRRGQPVYGAIDLTPRAEHRPDEWFGFLASGVTDATPEAVKVVDPQFEIAHLNTSEGSYWAIDGERIPDMEPLDRLRAYVETRTDIAFSPPRVVPLPAFVSRRKALSPRRHAAVVRLAGTSVRSFADAFLDLEVMEATSLVNHPVLRDILSEEANRSMEAENAERRAGVGGSTVPTGTMVPAEVMTGDRSVGCVVRLDRAADGAGGATFHCTLFVADAVELGPGSLLRRRSGLWPPGRPPRLLEREVGTVVSAGPGEPLPSAWPEPAQEAASASVRGLELVCLSCGHRHPGAQFDAESLEVAELTSRWHHNWEELALLRRTADLYRRFPEARGYVKPAVAAIMDSDDPDVLDQVMNNVPFDRIKPPRPNDYESKVAGWLAHDPKLREFLETCTFDLDARTRGVAEAEQAYRRKLRGRSVRCPACGDGLLSVVNPLEL